MSSVSEAKKGDNLVDIKGIDKIELLRALCRNAKPTSLNSFIKDSGTDLFFDECAAKSAIFGVWEKVSDASAKDDKTENETENETEYESGDELGDETEDESEDESEDETEDETKRKPKTTSKFKFVIKTTPVDKIIKYFNQRPIYCNLSGDKVDASTYDRYIKIAKKSKLFTERTYHSFQEVVNGMDVDM
jgi:hypothetical protein